MKNFWSIPVIFIFLVFWTWTETSGEPQRERYTDPYSEPRLSERPRLRERAPIREESKDPMDGVWDIIFENGIIGLVIAAQAFWIYTTDKNHRKDNGVQMANYVSLINQSNEHENKMEGIMGSMNSRMENLEREVESLGRGQEGIKSFILERLMKPT
tara:strand:+ start:469 stop:939 length:471 start_codon:yes stop_codon:yes gene_type:complete